MTVGRAVLLGLMRHYLSAVMDPTAHIPLVPKVENN